MSNGQTALHYLAPYIFRVAISNRHIFKLAAGHVTFRYKGPKGGQAKRCTLPAEEFIRRFLQHVLPQGLVKVRYYGLFRASHRPRLQQARQLLEAQPPTAATPETLATASPP